MPITLDIQHGTSSKRVEFYSTTITIGREAGSDILLKHPDVSRFHGLVRSEGDRYRLLDQESANGMRLRRGGAETSLGRGARKDIDLREGDEVIFGIVDPIQVRVVSLAPSRAVRCPDSAQATIVRTLATVRGGDAIAERLSGHATHMRRLVAFAHELAQVESGTGSDEQALTLALRAVAEAEYVAIVAIDGTAKGDLRLPVSSAKDEDACRAAELLLERLPSEHLWSSQDTLLWSSADTSGRPVVSCRVTVADTPCALLLIEKVGARLEEPDLVLATAIAAFLEAWLERTSKKRKAEVRTDRLRRRVHELERELDRERLPADLIARSPAFEREAARVLKLAERDFNVLLLGETGTGKTTMARIFHQSGARADKPFIEVNCGGIPMTLLESELFGHKRGSFTGAVRDQAGVFERAHGGVLFLDEIGEIPLELQGRLLKALEGFTTRIGETGSPRPPVDVRVISATNCDLAEAKRRFRDTLFARLGQPVEIPPLRERPEDIRALIKAMVCKLNKKLGMNVEGLTPAAATVLESYNYPQNARELQTILETVFGQFLGWQDRWIDVEHLPIYLLAPRDEAGDSPDANRRDQGGLGLKEQLDELEATIIRRALRETQNNVAAAARMLKLASRETLAQKIRRLTEAGLIERGG